MENGAGQDEEVQQILTTGWRTARLCAHETYMDCPFYEQLQYGGDARIQMLVSLYMAGDASLMRNGITLIDSTPQCRRRSRTAARLRPGAIHSALLAVVDRHGSRLSDVYRRPAVCAAHAARRARGAQLLRRLSKGERIAGANAVLEFRRLGGQAGRAARRPDDNDGSSAVFDLQLAMAYDWGADD